jgi:hypothetical protein
MLIPVMLSDVILSNVMLIAIILIVLMLTAVVPFVEQCKRVEKCKKYNIAEKIKNYLFKTGEVELGVTEGYILLKNVFLHRRTPTK